MSRNRRRRRLLCFDLLAETVGWWSLEAVRRLTGGANSRTLLRACRRNRAYKHAQRPRMAEHVRIGRGGVRIYGRSDQLTVLPADFPPQPSPPIITGFQYIGVDFNEYDSLNSFAEKASPLLASGEHRLSIRIQNRNDGFRWFCDEFGPVLRAGGFRPLSVSMQYSTTAEAVGALLRQPLVRDCPVLDIFHSAYASDDLVEWLHRPSAGGGGGGERTIVLSSYDLKASVKAFASAQGHGDARPYVLVCNAMRNEAPFRLENHESGEALVLDRLTRDHLRVEDLQSSFCVQHICASGKWRVLRRGCLVGPQLPLNWSPFHGGHIIDLTI